MDDSLGPDALCSGPRSDASRRAFLSMGAVLGGAVLLTPGPDEATAKRAPAEDDAMRTRAPSAEEAVPTRRSVSEDAAGPRAPVTEEAVPTRKPVSQDAAGPRTPSAEEAVPARTSLSEDAARTRAPSAEEAVPTRTADEAAAMLRQPRIYLRREWEARPPKSLAKILDRQPDKLIVHHTATPTETATTLTAAFALSRAIQRWHMRHNGWDDIGEQFTISRGGHIMEGRNRTMPAIRQRRHVLGAHAANHNSHALGIETEGTYSLTLPAEAQIKALVHLLAWLCSVYGLDPDTAIIGHRDVNKTSCPGDKLYAFLPELRSQVNRRLGREPRWLLRLGAPAAPRGYLPLPRHLHDHGPTLGRTDRSV